MPRLASAGWIAALCLAACAGGSGDEPAAPDDAQDDASDADAATDDAALEVATSDANDAGPQGDSEADAPTIDAPVPIDRSKCVASPDALGLTHRVAKGSAGGSMSYVAFAPASYDPRTALPLVIALHGAGDKSDNYFAAIWQGTAASKGLLVVTPEASTPAGPGFTWSGSDANLILDVVDDFERCYSVDPKRRLINGFSAGGIMAYLIGIEAADQFAGVMIASSDFDSAQALAGKKLLPAPWKIPVAHTHGVTDMNFPIAYARKGRDELLAAGHVVHWHEFDGGHTTTAAFAATMYDDLAASVAP